MVTYCAHQIASGENRATDSYLQPLENGLSARLTRWMRQVCCALRGHDHLVHFEKERMFLQCASCGHETPGWLLTEAPPRAVAARGDARRPAVIRAHLVSARRIA